VIFQEIGLQLLQTPRDGVNGQVQFPGGQDTGIGDVLLEKKPLYAAEMVPQSGPDPFDTYINFGWCIYFGRKNKIAVL
jgi:hypothetical protein